MTQAGTFEQLIHRHTEIEESTKEEQAGLVPHLADWLEPLQSSFVELPVHGTRDLTVADLEHADLAAEHFNAGRFTP